MQRIESEACVETRKKNIGLVEIYHTAEKYDLIGLLAGLRAESWADAKIRVVQDKYGFYNKEL